MFTYAIVIPDELYRVFRITADASAACSALVYQTEDNPRFCYM